MQAEMCSDHWVFMVYTLLLLLKFRPHSPTPLKPPDILLLSLCRDCLGFAFSPLLYNTPMPPAGFEPATPASDRPQTVALDRSATGIGLAFNPWIVQPIGSRYTD